MASSIRCRLQGCDLDDCGVCRRCGDAGKAEHRWQEADRVRPCFRRTVCSRCGKEKEQPEHDWDPTPGGLKCSRCGLAI